VRVPVIAAAGVSPGGRGARGVAAIAPSTATPLASTHPGVPARAITDELLGDTVPVRARKTMARGALLAATAMADLVRALGPGRAAGAGCFLGVGASAGAMPDLHAMLGAAIVDGAWSIARFGGPGLAACNPLLAFQLMNNFTMCHAAIQEGVSGPSGAYFSRGAGTVAALRAAVDSVGDGDCAIAIAGGADSALHPVTWAEMVRDGRGECVPGEGAGLIAIGDGNAIAVITVIATAPAIDRALIDRAVADRSEIVIAAPAAVRALVAERGVAIHDAGAAIGEALAATPALAWLTGLERIAAGAARVAILTVDGDGALGVVALEAP
jgi:Beta-ketoacyl synthase, N-terminal domain